MEKIFQFRLVMTLTYFAAIVWINIHSNGAEFKRIILHVDYKILSMTGSLQALNNS